jgi:hypothetical protein
VILAAYGGASEEEIARAMPLLRLLVLIEQHLAEPAPPLSPEERRAKQDKLEQYLADAELLHGEAGPLQ